MYGLTGNENIFLDDLQCSIAIMQAIDGSWELCTCYDSERCTDELLLINQRILHEGSKSLWSQL